MLADSTSLGLSLCSFFTMPTHSIYLQFLYFTSTFSPLSHTMSSLHDLHALLWQAERIVEKRKEALSGTQDAEEEARNECFMDPSDIEWSKARQATRRAHRKLEEAHKEANDFRSMID